MANAGLGDAFGTKVNATGSAFGYSTYFGGSGDEGAVASQSTTRATSTSRA